MKQMSMRAIIMVCICAVFVAGLVIFCGFYAIDADDWALYPANGHIYSSGEITRAGDITDRTGEVLATTKNGHRVYNSSSDIRRATLHAIGDPYGNISTGLHSSFLSMLCGYDRIDGAYQLGDKGNNIETTLDSEICATALNALGSRKGTVGVYNYKTGEIVCMVSTPTYDVEDEDEAKAAKSGEINGVYINRFLSATYPPGSTFKLVTTACALDTFDDVYTRTYRCNHGVTIDGEDISCMGYHGTLTLKEALAKSCNSYFSQLAVDLGKDRLTEYAEKMGFNKDFYMDGIKAKTSYFNVEKSRNIDLAWAGMGQYTNMMNPLQYITMLGAIANDGVPVQPYLVKSVKTSTGLTIKSGKARNGSRMLDSGTAQALGDLMASNVELNYGRGNYPGLELCAKSGTAEVGGDQTPNAVFVGFLRNEDLPLAFIVNIENGGSGSEYAGAVANTVLQKCKSRLS